MSSDEDTTFYDYAHKINWNDVGDAKKQKFFSLLKENRGFVINHLRAETSYDTRVSTLLITMIIVLTMRFLEFSNNSIIVSVILFQIIFAALLGALNVLSSILRKQSDKEMKDFINSISDCNSQENENEEAKV